jgi:hypothetical protein
MAGVNQSSRSFANERPRSSEVRKTKTAAANNTPAKVSIAILGACQSLGEASSANDNNAIAKARIRWRC